MNYGQPELYSLLTDSSVTSLLSNPAGIFYDTVVPAEYPDGSEVGAQASIVNYYRSVPINGAISYLDVSYSVNCRAPIMADAEAIQRAIFEVVNRHYAGSVYFRCDVLTPIPPLDQTDVYNAPLEIAATGRSI